MDRTVEYYWAGRQFHLSMTKEGNEQAQRMFVEALRLDRGFARALGHLSFTRLHAWLHGWGTPAEVAEWLAYWKIPAEASLDSVFDLAERAVALDAADYDNQWSLAIAHAYRRDFVPSMACYREAVTRAESDGAVPADYADLLAEMAETLIFMGRHDDAIGQIRRAMEINRVHPKWYVGNLGWALYQAGRYDESLATLQPLRRMPNLVRRYIVASQVRLGQRDAALAAAAEILKNDPTYAVAKESIWPYADPQLHQNLREALKSAGLP